MFHASIARLLVPLVTLVSVGCIQIQNYIPAVNCGPIAPLSLATLDETTNAALSRLEERDDVRWLEIDEPETGISVGGFISPEVGTRRSLIVLLCGAGTLEADGRRATALNAQTGYGSNFEQAGFRVWSPVLTEESAYNTRDVAETLACLRWLDGPGADWLGADRIYLIGYSTGGTTANRINLTARLTAVVSISGLTRPDQLIQLGPLYRFLAELFPCNSGFAQFDSTVVECTRNGCPKLDVVSHVAEIQNPTLFLQGEADPIHLPENLDALESAYREQLDAGAVMPELTFVYADFQGHFMYEEPEYVQVVLDYLDLFEPADSGAERGP